MAAGGTGIELRCSLAQEASVYRCMEPLPALECDRVTCPVGIGMGGQEEGLHGRLARSGAALQAELRRGQLYRLVYITN